MVHLSDLINNLPPYHFANAKKKIAERKAAGVDVISLSMGDPDLPAPRNVIDRLCLEIQETENHRYPEYFGMRALHEAFAAWFKRRFDVQLTPERDMLPLLGSKEGLAYAGAAVLNTGDISLIPDPYYRCKNTFLGQLYALLRRTFLSWEVESTAIRWFG
jgi:LL-diaminopimelate aminotransferase